MAVSDTESAKRLNWVIVLLTANLIAMLAIAFGLVFRLLPKVERAVQTTERVEARFQLFADEVQPVVAAGANKAIETIKKVDADQISENATKKANTIIDAATDRAKRLLERDKKTNE